MFPNPYAFSYILSMLQILQLLQYAVNWNMDFFCLPGSPLGKLENLTEQLNESFYNFETHE